MMPPCFASVAALLLGDTDVYLFYSVDKSKKAPAVKPGLLGIGNLLG
jgi:hypothetical protein